MQPTGKQFKNFIVARRAANKEAAAPTETPAPKNFIAKKRAEVALKAEQTAKDAQQLKPQDAEEPAVERSEAQRPGAKQADAHSDGHRTIATAVAARRASSRPDEVDSTE